MSSFPEIFDKDGNFDDIPLQNIGISTILFGKSREFDRFMSQMKVLTRLLAKAEILPRFSAEMEVFRRFLSETEVLTCFLGRNCYQTFDREGKFGYHKAKHEFNRLLMCVIQAALCEGMCQQSVRQSIKCQNVLY